MADTYGSVYVFNLYVENITKLVLNGQGSAGSINAPGAAPYTPNNLAVLRSPLTVHNLQDPQFVQGDNSVTVDVLGQSWSGTLNIDPVQAPALTQDLWLYVATVTDNTGNTNGLMLLFTTGGVLIKQAPLLSSASSGGPSGAVSEDKSGGEKGGGPLSE